MSAPSPPVSVAFLDPPILPHTTPRPWRRFAFSDIAWSLASQWKTVRQSEDAFAIYSAYDEAPEFKHVRVVNLRTPGILLRNSILQAPAYARFGRRIARDRHDVLHGVDYYSLAIASLFTRAVPIVTTPGNITERIATGYGLDPVVNSTLGWALATLRRRRAWIHATSEYMADWWVRSGFDRSRVLVVPLPTLFAGTQLRFERAVNELGWSRSELNILLVAGARNENELRLVANFVQQLVQYSHSTPSRTRKAVRLHLIGPASASEIGLRDSELANGDTVRAQFYGRVAHSELVRFYSAADALLVTRRHNATPRVALEALQAGTPVISNHAPSLMGHPFEEAYVLGLDISDAWSTHASGGRVESVLHDIERLRSVRDDIKSWANEQIGSVAVAREVRELYTRAAESAPSQLHVRP